MRPIGLIRLTQTGIILLLALATPVMAVLDEKFWFEKRVGLAAAAVVLLALLAARIWRIGRIGPIGRIGRIGPIIGWLLFGAALLVAAAVPTGRISNLATTELWAGVGAVLAYFAIKNTTSSSRQIKLGFFGVLGGLAVAAAATATGIGRIGPMGPIGPMARDTLQLLQRSPIWGEFREFRVARLGILQTASGLGILGILGILAITYQLVLKSAREILKSSSIWWKALNLLVLLLLAGFLVLPHPALMLWPLAVAAALSCGIGQIGPIGPIGPIRRVLWAGFVGVLIVVVLVSSYGLGRVAWGEMKFREALAAANRNEGIATYYALLEAIRHNPYEVRYHLLASQIDLALANSIAAQAGVQEVPGGQEEPERESTPSAGLTTQDQTNILILIQQAVVEGKAAVQLDPENSTLWQNLASIYRALIGVAGGAEDWALKCYQRAAELAPQDPTSRIRIGEIHYLAGNFEGAREAFAQAVELGPQLPLAYYDLAVAQNALGETEKAVAALEKVLTLLPADAPDREQVEKDLEFLKGEIGRIGPIGPMEKEATSSAELREATSSAEVEAPPPPVGPEEATESAETKPIEVVP